MPKIPLILASQSPNRLALLEQIGLKPDKIIPADIDESEKKDELPRNLAKRLAEEKCEKVASEVESGYIIAADSVPCVGRRTLPKALTKEDIIYCLRLMNGRRHRLYTGVTIIKKDGDSFTKRSKVVCSTIKWKRMTDKEIEEYASKDEGLNKAGGYSISASGEMYMEFISGSFSNIVGLPLFETRNMLTSLGFWS